VTSYWPVDNSLVYPQLGISGGYSAPFDMSSLVRCGYPYSAAIFGLGRQPTWTP
jgi:hypothetical protein